MIKIIKAIYHAIKSIYNLYVYPQICNYGAFSNNAKIQVPAQLVNPKNIYIEEYVSIGKNSIIFAPVTKIIIKKMSYSGPNLFISSGNHYSKVGSFSRLLSDNDKVKDNMRLNWDVIIEEDVWIGANVSILCKIVGRGAIVACGSVCKKDILPYTIVGGVPAKIIKKRFTIDEIIEHEKRLYSENERLSKEYLMEIFKNI